MHRALFGGHAGWPEDRGPDHPQSVRRRLRVGRRPARNFCAALVPDRGATLTVAGASPQERAIGNMRSARPRGGASSPTRKKADPGRTTMKLLISAAAALALAGAASA